MNKKVILISIDGMRPDGMQQCGHPFVKELESRCAYSYAEQSVFPSVTLPCHFSMTHSVPPQRHGILTNTYIPQVRPVKGIFEKIAEAGGRSAFLYGWDPIHDCVLPGALKFAVHVNTFEEETGDTVLTDEAIRLIDRYHPDFVFLYMVETDDKGGHKFGWMSEEYLRRISVAIENTKRVMEHCADEYSFIITADHGGHDRSHGTDLPEDMTVPFFLCDPSVPPGPIDTPVSILDVAPTIAAIMGLVPDPEWEGKAIL